jgi:hypothetical protein
MMDKIILVVGGEDVEKTIEEYLEEEGAENFRRFQEAISPVFFGPDRGSDEVKEDLQPEAEACCQNIRVDQIGDEHLCDGCCPECENAQCCDDDEPGRVEALDDAVDRRRRMQALKATLDEVRYQDDNFLKDDSAKDLEDWATLIQIYLDKVKYHELMGEGTKAKCNMRKVAALAVNAMANRGIITRN